MRHLHGAEAAFDEFEGELTDLLSQDLRLKTWTPAPEHWGDDWNKDEITRLSALRIPKSPHGNEPELLLYRLGNLDFGRSLSTRIQNLTTGNSHVFLADTFGTGKTRLLYETMTKHWSIYFSCCGNPGTSLYGSSDLHESIKTVSGDLIGNDHQQIYRMVSVSTRMSKKSALQLAHNRRLASYVFDRLLLSRLLYFQRFLAVAERLSIPEGDARYKWLMIQICSLSVLGDPFQLAMDYTSRLSDADVAHRLYEASVQLKSKFEFIIIDEMQAAIKSSKAFATADHTHHSPILREFLISIGNHLPSKRLILAGTTLETSVVREALQASRMQNHSIRHFHDLGGLTSQEECTAYIKHFFADSVSDEDCRLAFTWMRGRHCFIASLVTMTLLFGARNFRHLLNSAVFHCTGYCSPGSDIIPYDPLFNEFRVLFKHEELERERAEAMRISKLTEAESQASGALRKAAINYALRGSSTTYKKDCDVLIGLSAARFAGSSTSVVMAEPLVLMSLAHWVCTSANAARIHNVIRIKLHNTSPLSLEENAFVEGLAPCLWDALFLQIPLCDLFRFAHTTPNFAKQSTNIVLPRLSRRQIFASISERPKKLLRVAESPEDVLTWLRDASEPFIIPDPSCAADLMFLLQLGDRQCALAVVQLKTVPVSKSRPERHHRVVPADVTELYKNAPQAQEMLLSLLKNLPPLSIAYQKRTRGTDALKKFARFPIIRVLCFSEPWRAHEAYDPPVAMIKFDQLLSQPAPQEFSLSGTAQSLIDISY